MPSIVYVSVILLVGLFQESSGSCVRNGVDYWGADTWNLMAYSFDECSRVCKAARSCKSITYRPSDRRCWLKYRKGGNHGPSLGGGLVSANMDCNNKRDQSCVKRNVDYWGADLGGRRANSFDQCEQFCRDTERCVSITYRASSKTCWLKHRKSGARGPTNGNGLLSLNMDCPASGLQNSNCAHNNIDFWGADIVHLVTDRNNVGMCEGFCREEPRCVSFTYRSSTGNCWLKHQQYGARGPSHSNGLISMNMNCSK